MFEFTRTTLFIFLLNIMFSWIAYFIITLATIFFASAHFSIKKIRIRSQQLWDKFKSVQHSIPWRFRRLWLCLVLDSNQSVYQLYQFNQFNCLENYIHVLSVLLQLQKCVAVQMLHLRRYWGHLLASIKLFNENNSADFDTSVMAKIFTTWNGMYITSRQLF